MTHKEIAIITVDGPGGAGKGTLSSLLARRLGYHLLDSGAVYRLLALAALHQGIALDDTEALVSLAKGLQMRFDVDEDGVQTVYLDDQDVTAEIRAEACANAASRIAAIERVRAALLRKQREFCRPPGLVADGRDMGSVVFPQADKKIFLVASLAERAHRRYKQLKGQGNDASLDALLNELARRDERDERRSVAPLKPAEDAIIIDSTGLSIERVLEQALKLVR